MELGYCIECREIFINNEGKDDCKNNHQGHKTYLFGAPKWYSPPICAVLTKLHAREPISNNEITLFKLAIDLGDLDNFINLKTKK
jgi:hypothetical protein